MAARAASHAAAAWCSAAILLVASCEADAQAGHAAQPYPGKPVRVIVGFAPGGSVDIVARQITPKLTAYFGQPFVVDNRSGGGGSIGVDIAVKATPDGHTITVVGAGYAANAALYKTANDPVTGIAPIIEIGFSPHILAVHPSVPARSVKELIAYAKAHPGQLAYTSSGERSVTHLATELFANMGGLNLIHVPYRGAALGLIDVVGGRVQMIIGSMPPTLPLVRSGKLNALAVTTAQRWHTTPELPTIAETLAGTMSSCGLASGRHGNARRHRRAVERGNQQIDARGRSEATARGGRRARDGRGAEGLRRSPAPRRRTLDARGRTRRHQARILRAPSLLPWTSSIPPRRQSNAQRRRASPSRRQTGRRLPPDHRRRQVRCRLECTRPVPRPLRAFRPGARGDRFDRHEGRLASPGVKHVFTGEDAVRAGYVKAPHTMQFVGKNGMKARAPERPVLAHKKVRFVGEAIALVVADSAEAAQDAADLVEIEYRDLQSVTDPEGALAAGAPQLSEEVPGNLAWESECRRRKGRRSRVRLRCAYHPRQDGLYPRRAESDGAAFVPRRVRCSDRNVSHSTLPMQGVTTLRSQLANYTKVPADKLTSKRMTSAAALASARVAYPEYAALMIAAKTLGAPVKWMSARVHKVC